jgi:hypothetical protein
MRIISAVEAEAVAVSDLGFDSEYIDLATPEALSAAIRKTASFVCPCTTQALARVMIGMFRPLHPEEALDDLIRDAIDSLVGYGDLVEASDIDAPKGSPVLYLAPPSFVQVSEQLFLLFGIIPDGEDPIPPELSQNITPVLCTRRLRVTDAHEATEALLQAGYIRRKLEAWLKCPPPENPTQFVAKYDKALSQSGPPGTPEDVLILDPSRSVMYYKGRWTNLKKQTGRFISRRSKTHCAQLWCYIEAVDGNVTRLLDFPLFESRWNAFDEAWHLSQALDTIAGHPQVFSVRKNSNNTVIMDFFSPAPAWARHRWDCIGERTVSNSALFSYVFPAAEVDRECRFATERMWLQQR